MGYETKMYVAEVFDFLTEEDCFYAHVVGMVDLCKLRYSSETARLIAKQTTKEPVVYFYGTDGNIPILRDKYDNALGVISVSDMLEAIEKDGTEYRRLALAKALLESVTDMFDLSRTFVITYGH